MNLNQLIKKYKHLISYAFFGVCTTLINLLCYKLFYNFLEIPNVVSTIFAWFFAVLFAFITNKLWVFESKSLEKKVVISELWKFFVCRFSTGILDVLIMYLTVDLMHWNAMICKFFSNILVIILNYIASRLIIFVKSDRNEKN